MMAGISEGRGEEQMPYRTDRRRQHEVNESAEKDVKQRHHELHLAKCIIYS